MRIPPLILIMSVVMISGILIIIWTSFSLMNQNLRLGINNFGAWIPSCKSEEARLIEISVEEYMQGPLAQDDERIINYIKSNDYLRTPSPKPYNLTKPTRDPSMGQSQIIKKLFGEKRNGFFVECGALDGETRSNTLSLERDLGWGGLLIEGDPKNFDILLSKNRKAWSINSCLAIHPYPHKVIFKQKFNIGKIKFDDLNDYTNATNGDSEVVVQCFPFFSILTALDIQVVDFFSLDIEGFEMDALRTIPFDSILIKVLTVEFVHGKGGANELIKFMTQKGYKVVTKLTNDVSLANDVIFAHESFNVTQEFPDVIRSESMKLN